MKIIGLLETDLVNYKKPCMVVEFPKCDFKCDRECGKRVCQNWALSNYSSKDIAIEDIINRYLNNPLTSAIVCQGLEPFDTYNDLTEFLDAFRKASTDDIVIFTGYKKEEIQHKFPDFFGRYSNIIIKFGRFVPDCEAHYDPILGIELASPNQYGEKIG